MALKPQFAATPKIGVGTLSLANTARDGTGTLGTTIINVLSAGTNGTRLQRIAVNATATTTAGMVRFYLHDGTTSHLFLEVPVAAITPGGTVQSFSYSATEVTNPEMLPLVIPSGYSIRASTHNAEAFRATVSAADL